VSAWESTPCKSCSAPVIWATTTRGKAMPVDPDPVVEGNLVLEARFGDAPPLARVLGVAKQFGRKDLRVAHFVTCPQAGQWRRRGRT
jgi:hypothetical protein